MSSQIDAVAADEAFDDLFSFADDDELRSFAGSEFILQIVKELQKAYLEEKASGGLTQQIVAERLGGLHRSVVNRRLLGKENMSARVIGELAWALNRRPDFALCPLLPAHGENSCGHWESGGNASGKVSTPTLLETAGGWGSQQSEVRVLRTALDHA